MTVALGACTSVAAQQPATSKPTPAVKPATSGPSIVFIISDDETYAEAQNAATNTHLDRNIAAHGITFTNAIIPNPLCCPSRTSILRGQFSSATKVWTNRGQYGGWLAAHAAGDENSTIATWLHAKGYRTGLVGKYLNGYDESSYIPPGWDYWRAEEINDAGGGGGYYGYKMSVQGRQVRYGKTPADYSVDVMTGYATRFIRTTPRSQPLFLYVGYRSPHAPRTPAPRYLNDSRCNRASTAGLPDYRVAGAGAPDYILQAPELPGVAGVDGARRRVPLAAGGGRRHRRHHPGAVVYRPPQEHDAGLHLRQRLHVR